MPANKRRPRYGWSRYEPSRYEPSRYEPARGCRRLGGRLRHIPCLRTIIPRTSRFLHTACSRLTDPAHMSRPVDADPLLSTRCKLPGRSLWFSRAHLHEDHIEISGWNWKGRFSRRIRLSNIDRFQWWAVLNDVNFLLHLKDGAPVPLQLLRSAGTWSCKLHELLGQSMLAQDPLPRVHPHRDVAAA